MHFVLKELVRKSIGETEVRFNKHNRLLWPFLVCDVFGVCFRPVLRPMSIGQLELQIFFFFCPNQKGGAWTLS